MSEAIRPFLAIWVEPRETVRRIVNTDPTHNVIGLVMIRGAVGRLELAWFAALSRPGSVGRLWPIGVALRAALGAVLGVVGLYVGAWSIRLFCRLLGGVASNLEMRTAIAWSSIPGITASIASITLVLLGILSAPEFRHSMMPVMTASTTELGLLNAVLLVWGFIVQLQCIGEVNRFSAWRAFGAILLMAAVLAALLLMLVLLGGMPHHGMSMG